MTHTRTIARLQVSSAAYDEIYRALADADHRRLGSIDVDGMIDMSCLGIQRKEEVESDTPITLQEMVERHGRNWKDVVADLSLEQAYLKQFGLTDESIDRLSRLLQDLGEKSR